MGNGLQQKADSQVKYGGNKRDMLNKSNHNANSNGFNYCANDSVDKYNQMLQQNENEGTFKNGVRSRVQLSPSTSSCLRQGRFPFEKTTKNPNCSNNDKNKNIIK